MRKREWEMLYEGVKHRAKYGNDGDRIIVELIVKVIEEHNKMSKALCSMRPDIIHGEPWSIASKVLKDIGEIE